MPAIHVKFWGTRGSIPTPGPRTRRYGGNTLCVEIRMGETLIICDGGSGMRELGDDLIRRGGKIRAHLLFSHTHWDHIQGFPFFRPAYAPTSEFHIYDQHDRAGHFYRILSGQMKSDYFPVQLSDLKALILPEVMEGVDGAGRIVIGGVITRSIAQCHPGGSLGYSFENPDGSGKVVYATDNEFDKLLTGNGRETHAGPRPVSPALVDFVRGADLLIADSQFTDDEYPTRAGWGHPSCLTTLDLAVQAGVKRLALFHHDPSRSDEQVDAMVSECSERARSYGSPLIVFGAREGMELVEGRE